ncbi:ABC transporter ATP-binding protein [Paenibacillus peoriae]|uniref:ABC transporter ATP-binding protein n=1 Tax=Paenibacillus peoriae TaxID=59893 RepID=UPI00026C5B6E|nr:ABC transporter ATP-binding protein [Paenibacillus peoriae]MEC0183187.1 ABC transporter ATP-binding protein [Paenibacillus peoriae]
MNAYLDLQGINKTYGNSSVLHQVDLNVEKGELVTLLGPSGCGKSTLLRCIAGLVDLDQGEILLDKKNISNLPPRSREIGMVFQSYALFPNLTVRGNIEYGLKIKGLKSAERHKRVEELLAMVDLEDREKHYPNQLSGGQQQRVALARSLAMQPKLLLLDEPLSALDAKIRKNLRAEIRNIQKRFQMTTMFVTHDQEEALAISDRVCVMDKGRIVQEGTPENVYSAPKTEFIARFMGNYNVLNPKEAARLFQLDNLEQVSYAVRPEAISIQNDQRIVEDTKCYVTGYVRSVAILGNVIRYTVLSQEILLTVDVLNDGRSAISEGEAIRLELSRSSLLQLDKEGA